MRFLALILSLMICAVVRAQEPGSAYDAMSTVGAQLNRQFLNQIVSVIGANGTPQPRTWRVLVIDGGAAGGLREIEIRDGRIVAQRTPMPGEAGSAGLKPISTSKLHLDSSGAFSVAAYTADRSHIEFSSVSYLLRNNARGIPTWIVTLIDSNGQSVGTIHIGADRGRVTRVENMFRGTNSIIAQQDAGAPNRPRRAADEQIEYDGDEDDDGDVNPVKAEIKRAFRKTKDGAQRIFGRVRRSFEDFINR